MLLIFIVILYSWFFVYLFDL